jgi:hypothetical protein
MDEPFSKTALNQLPGLLGHAGHPWRWRELCCARVSTPSAMTRNFGLLPISIMALTMSASPGSAPISVTVIHPKGN